MGEILNLKNNNDNSIPPMQDVEHSIFGIDMPVLPNELSLGSTIVGGKYKVLEYLGRGGMGIVYKCWDEVSKIEVALKTIAPELSGSLWEMDGIIKNFQLVHNLHHPNIASYNILERDSASGIYYLVMEYVDGEDLRYYLRNLRMQNSLEPSRIVAIVNQIAEALDYAHSQKILHRDIKPGNIKITNKGKVKLLDFGLAAQIHGSLSKVSLQKVDTSGTLPYISPEQWRGKKATEASDQYALAVTVYEAFAGELPFDNPDKDIMRSCVLEEIPEPLTGVPENIQSAVARALSKTPAERFKNCQEFAAALSGIAIQDKDVGKIPKPTIKEPVRSLTAEERAEFYLLSDRVNLLIRNYERQYNDCSKLPVPVQDMLQKAQSACNGNKNSDNLAILKSAEELLNIYPEFEQLKNSTSALLKQLQEYDLKLPKELKQYERLARQTFADGDIIVSTTFLKKLQEPLKQFCDEENKRREAERLAQEKAREEAERIAREKEAAEKKTHNRRKKSKLQQTFAET